MQTEQKRWALLLDLDDTLVLTSALKPLRDKGEWKRVYASFHLTSLPPGTHQFLQRAHTLAPLGVGIVTRSPRMYAEKLLAYHHLQLQVVVAYHDTPRRKPHRDPLLKAAERLNTTATRCIYVGDDIDDIRAAVSARSIPIGLSWDGLLRRYREAKQAYALCANWDEVVDAIRAIVGIA